MAAISGGYIPLDFTNSENHVGKSGLEHNLVYTSSRVNKGLPGDWKFYPVPIGGQYHYRIRAWNTVWNDWEFWTSVGSPNPNPPSGDIVTHVTLIGIQEL